MCSLSHSSNHQAAECESQVSQGVCCNVCIAAFINSFILLLLVSASSLGANYSHSHTHRYFPTILIVLLAVFNDGAMIALSKDRVVPSPTPNTWRLRNIFIVGIVYGLYLTVSSWALFHIAAKTRFFENNIRMYSLNDTLEELVPFCTNLIQSRGLTPSAPMTTVSDTHHCSASMTLLICGLLPFNWLAVLTAGIPVLYAVFTFVGSANLVRLTKRCLDRVACNTQEHAPWRLLHA